VDPFGFVPSPRAAVRVGRGEAGAAGVEPKAKRRKVVVKAQATKKIKKKKMEKEQKAKKAKKAKKKENAAVTAADRDAALRMLRRLQWRREKDRIEREAELAEAGSATESEHSEFEFD
jgi:3'-phosphoadenosine 5'-phosphosulfate (PAPS) 3'-phosphatase